MYEAVFDDEALDDLRRIFARIAKSNQPAAERLVARIFDKVACLLTPELKQMGRPGQDPGTRELIEWMAIHYRL